MKKQKINSLLVLVILAFCTSTVAQTKSNSLLKEVRSQNKELFTKTKCISKLGKAFNDFLKEKKITFKKHQKNRKCFDCSTRILDLAVVVKEFSIVSYTHTGRAEHIHLVVFNSHTKQYENFILPYKITSKEELFYILDEEKLEEVGSCL